jgi:hypothetical protein
LNSMEMHTFAQKVRDALGKELGEAYSVELKEVKKNNGVILQGLMIQGREGNVVPTIYLETFYAAYEDGIPFSEVLRRIYEIYSEEMPRGKVDMEFFKSFCKVRDRICYRLIRRKGNEALLAEIPHVEFLDLAICFYYAYSSGTLGEGSILVYHSHMSMWGVKTQDLMRLAEENTPRLFPARLTPLSEVLNEIADVCGESEPSQEIPLTVLTNERRIHGASCILYPDTLKRLGEKSGKGIYIIPSSIHEVLLLERSGGESPAELKKMIYEVNRTHLAPEEVLSDNLYLYDPVEKKVKIIF